jgi:phosphotransferase family enzyme
VAVDDAVLPAAAHLTGSRADRVLAAAVAAVGGTLQRARPCHLHYRPGRDVVVRFDSSVCWGGRAPVTETLIAATHVAGPPDGTLPVEAITADGVTLSVGVWRWPFDPVLLGLGDAVTPSRAAVLLAGLSDGRVRLEVVSYRPTQRAVVRAVDAQGGEVYIKAVPPGDVEDLVDRHRRLLAVGVPVPEVLRHDAGRGLIVTAALGGLTVRDRIKRGHRTLPAAGQYEELYLRLAAARLGRRRHAINRTRAALHHATMLAAVLPSSRPRLDRLAEHLAPATHRADDRSGPTIHGDLYEAQLVTGRGRGRAGTLTGVLDLDDCGPGDPYDDRATVLAHLIDRVVDDEGAPRRRIADYVGTLRSSFGEQVDAGELDLVTAGTIVGLATGPFRLQRPRWQAAVRRRLAVAERLASSPGERRLRLGR